MKALEELEEEDQAKGEGRRPLPFLLGSSNPSGLHFLGPVGSSGSPRENPLLIEEYE